MRQHSFFDGTNCRCCTTSARNLFMFILVTVTFMILPVLLLLEALAIQFTADTTDLSTSVQEAEEMGLARML